MSFLLSSKVIIDTLLPLLENVVFLLQEVDLLPEFFNLAIGGCDLDVLVFSILLDLR